MRAVFEGRPPTEAPPAPAAALVPLFEEDGEARVILIRRATSLLHNPGEIAFPGGRAEPGETMVEAALREAEEEVALDPRSVEVVGWLDRVTARTSGSVVTPVVGFLTARPQLVAAPAEVEAILDVALSELLTCCREEDWGRPMYFFDLGEDTVWGMTARVLYHLLAEVTGRTAPPAQGPAREREGATPPAPA